MPDSLNIQPPHIHSIATPVDTVAKALHPAAGDTIAVADTTYAALDTTAVNFAYEQMLLRGDIVEEQAPPAPPA